MTAPTVPTAPLPSLLPCPFCGSTDIELHGDILFDGRWAVCNGCCCTMSECGVTSDAEAIARWNRRSDTALLTMQREGRMAIAERVYHSALGSADVRFRIALEAALSATKEE